MGTFSFFYLWILVLKISDCSGKSRDWGKLLLIVYEIKFLQFFFCFYLIICWFWVFISILEHWTCLKPCLIFHNWPFFRNWRLVNVVPKSQYVFLFVFLKLEIKFNDLLNRVSLVSRKFDNCFEIIAHKINNIISCVDWILFFFPINVVLFHVFFWRQECSF